MKSLSVWLFCCAAFLCGAAELETLPVKAVLFPFREAELLSRIDGTVQKCAFRIGERFKTGDVIMKIDDRRYRIEVTRMQAKADDIRIQAKFAQDSFQSYQKLFEEKIQSKSELDRRRAEADSLAARERIAAADLEEAKMLLDYCVLKAPFPGRIEQIMCREFETVRAGQVLLRVIDDAQLLAVVNVPLALLKPVGSPLEFLFDEGKFQVTGRIYEISPRADHRSGTIEIKALIPNSSGTLTAGMIGVWCPPRKGGPDHGKR